MEASYFHQTGRGRWLSRLGTRLFLRLLIIGLGFLFWFNLPLAAQTQPAVSSFSDPANNLTNSLGTWIWAPKISNQQVCLFWRAFDLPATNTVKRARLRMTADNEFVLFLDGRELGRGSEWREIYQFDVTALLHPGHHVLAVQGVNFFSDAGMIFGLWIEFADGQIMEIKSDTGWRIAPEGTKGWETYLAAPADWMTPITVSEIGVEPRWVVPQNVTGADLPDPENSPTHSLGRWIWAAQTADLQVCLFWRALKLPADNPIKHARLRMTADDEFELFLDGRQLGRGSEWREIYMFDVTALLPPGEHVLAVKAANSFSLAGMIFGLWIEFADGQTREIKSDASWRIAPEGTKNWKNYLVAPADWTIPITVGEIGIRPRWVLPDSVNVMPTLQPLVVRFWQRGWFQLSVLALLVIITGFSLWLLTQLAFHHKEKLLLERERSRIAADIHDDLGSRVTQLVLHGEVAQSELQTDSPVRPQLERICEEARQVLSTMDEVLWAVNPERDTLRDFTAFVCCYAEEFLKPTVIQCRLEVEQEMPASPLDLPLRRNLLMAIKETLNNAVKHSTATELLLQIRRHGQKLIVVVRDNGKGFGPGDVAPDRNGLPNMARRMKELGGSCRITSQPGQGCEVAFSIPLHPARRFPGSWFWRSRQDSASLPESQLAPKTAPHEHDSNKE